MATIITQTFSEKAMQNNGSPLATAAKQDVADYEDFVENGAIGLHIVDGNEIILRANKAELAMMGYGADEYVGRNIADFHADAPVIQDILTRLTNGEKLDRYSARLRTKDGDIRDVLITSSALFRNRKFVNTRCFTMDVTEAKRTQDILSDERRKAEKQQALLIRELHHRVKNTLAAVNAIMSTTMRFSSSMEEFKNAFTNRVVALGKTHSLLTEEMTQTIDFKAILMSELEPFDDGTGRVSLKGGRVTLAAELAVPLGMAIHELTTNAVKYGALSILSGTLAIEWTAQEDRLTFSWVEANVPDVQEPKRGGFGQVLLKKVLPQQLSANVQLDYTPDGLRVKIDLPSRVN